MTPELLDARPLEGYRVWLRFSDGTEGEIELGGELWGEVFEPLKSPERFRELRVDPELRTLVWPSGADFAPEFLYGKLRAGESTAADVQNTLTE